MNFPVWDLGFAHGLLIGVVAILHVFVSHFAIGGGFFLVLTEVLARRRNNAELLGYLKTHSRFFILVTLVFGAISGVGIWFTIGLINPAGTSALIRAFVWGWAIEWVFFIVEITAALIYYYGWDRMSAGGHMAVGAIYAGAAWLSMVVINGILSFQMTPGHWIQTHDFWQGFFNPTYFPSLLTRTFFSLGLAGLFALVTGSRIRSPLFRRWLVSYAGFWTIIPLIASVLLSFWWWSAVPTPITDLVAGEMPVSMLVYRIIPTLTIILAALVLIGPLLLPRIVTLPFALLILIGGLVVMGAGEWLREAVRKPYIIFDYMYVNGIRTAEATEIVGQGYLETARWVPATEGLSPEATGEAIFRVACLNCHARDGYNGLRNPVLGWDPEFARGVVKRLEHLRGPMPPWLGTDAEAGAVAAWLVSLNPPESRLEPGVDDRPAFGKRIFESRCAICHTVDGFRPIRELVEGSSAEDLSEYLQDMESDVMPPFTGDDSEQMALAAYLARLGGETR